MSYYSPYVLDALRQTKQAQDPRGAAGAYQLDPLSGSDERPCPYPYAFNHNAPTTNFGSHNRAPNLPYTATLSGTHTTSNPAGLTQPGYLRVPSTTGASLAAPQHASPSYVFDPNDATRRRYAVPNWPRQPIGLPNRHRNSHTYSYAAGIPLASATSLPFEPSQIWSMPPLPSVPASASSGEYGPAINRLPSELLSLIFVDALSIQLCDATPNKRAIPLVVSHVCQYWRVVAVGTPDLWRWLCLTACSSGRGHRRLELAKAYIDRSQGVGMTVSYRDAEVSTVFLDHWDVVVRRQGLKVPAADERCYCVLDLLIARIAEVRVLELIIGHASSARLSSIPLAAVSKIRNLVVRFLEGGERVHTLARLYASLPQLRRFTWASHMGVCSIPPPIHVPWPQLLVAHIDDSPLTHGTFLNMISSGQHLTEVRVRLSRDAQSPAPLRVRISQHALQSLTIYGDEPIDVALNGLHLPSLRTLSLRSNTFEAPAWPVVDARSLQYFIASISPGLDSLKLTPAPSITEKELLSILVLPQMATLTSLDVRLVIVTDSLFALLHPCHTAPLLPHLKELLVAKCATTDGTIADMITTRRQYGYPLQYVDIAFMRREEGLHPKDVAGFRRLESYGMFVGDRY